MNHDSELREAEARVSATQTRILFYEDSLSDLLCSRMEEDDATPAIDNREVQRLA